MLSNKSAHKFLDQSGQLAFAIPQVVTARLTKMALAGTAPSLKDQQELYLMGAEKVWAFYESWWAMSLEMAQKNQRLMEALFVNPWKALNPVKLMTPAKVQKNVLDVMNKGMEPVRKRAVANAKRLSKSKI